MKKVVLVLFVLVFAWQNKSSAQSAMPNDSLYVFTKYMQRNVHYPKVAADNGVQGRVVLDVNVTLDQTFTDIKIFA